MMLPMSKKATAIRRVKWIRLQSGWARTEKEKGIYDFAWLDDIVDNLIVRGLKPWMCLAYGNGIYTAEANKIFGAVGCPPIETERERCAWDRYVFCGGGTGKMDDGTSGDLS